MDSLGTRDSFCAVAGAASWSASWACLGMKGCLPKKGRKDLAAQTHRLHQHAASVLPQHCLEEFFYLFFFFVLRLASPVGLLYSVVLHLLSNFLDTWIPEGLCWSKLG